MMLLESESLFIYVCLQCEDTLCQQKRIEVNEVDGNQSGMICARTKRVWRQGINKRLFYNVRHHQPVN